MTEMIRASAPIEELDFTVGTYNSLKRSEIGTVAELACLTEDEVLTKIPMSLSPHKRLDEIKVRLKANGRTLATTPPSKPSVAPQIP